jgi:CCR4-NOT transcriptional complex subunit CAF120
MTWCHVGERLTCADGRACGDRQWVECYAQLVGTVLSLWDSAALDAAGGEEVPATFINLADASIKMVRYAPSLGDSI